MLQQTKNYKVNCSTCKLNMGGKCTSHLPRPDNGQNIYGTSIKEAKKLYPRGCSDWGISLFTLYRCFEKV